MDSIDVRTMGPDKSPHTEKDVEICQVEAKIRRWQETPFPVDEDINSRVVLYEGDERMLIADALVNPTNENLTQLDYATRLAGEELEKYIRKKVRLCATGDVRVTPGFASKFKHIIHAVPPKYQPKYKTAAETALFHTYFRIIETLLEKKIRTLVMPTLVTKKCDLPVEDNFHLQLRIVRRLLEKKHKDIDKIVIHLRHGSESLRSTFFYYFPRNSIDETMACYRFSGSVGGPNGEPVVPGREIRIKSKPSLSGEHECSIDLSSGLDLSTVVGRTPFSKMQEDPAKSLTPITTAGPRNGIASSEIAVRPKMFRSCTLL